eukprot:TRINITY_DN7897_c0_g1_i1.p1 TRINITY_DN7897_c0_g1~~TRINITY_DN7897_c0_g1_i1.p1  ORF type:complete len:330 (+),score=74.66 TRINITY_DN7897_c0_g1_i1:24-1013(+)
MGCLFSEPREVNSYVENDSKYYGTSFEQVFTEDRDVALKYSVHQNVSNEKVVVLPENPAGNTFSIIECNNSHFYFYRMSESAQIADCKNCVIFIGPVFGAVYIDGCDNCEIYSISHQLRIRDSQNMKFHTYCTSRPSVEGCKFLEFTSLKGGYNLLANQLMLAQINPFANKWSFIFNFDNPMANQTKPIEKFENVFNCGGEPAPIPLVDSLTYNDTLLDTYGHVYQFDGSESVILIEHDSFSLETLNKIHAHVDFILTRTISVKEDVIQHLNLDFELCFDELIVVATPYIEPNLKEEIEKIAFICDLRCQIFLLSDELKEDLWASESIE